MATATRIAFHQPSDDDDSKRSHLHYQPGTMVAVFRIHTPKQTNEVQPMSLQQFSLVYSDSSEATNALN